MVDRNSANEKVCVGDLHTVGATGIEGLGGQFIVMRCKRHIFKGGQSIAQSFKLLCGLDAAQQLFTYGARQRSPRILNQLGERLDRSDLRGH